MTNLRPILTLARQRPQAGCLETRPKGDRPSHGTPCLPLIDQTTANLGMPNESFSTGVGMTK
jgi:hypothetical protein